MIIKSFFSLFFLSANYSRCQKSERSIQTPHTHKRKKNSEKAEEKQKKIDCKGESFLLLFYIFLLLVLLHHFFLSSFFRMWFLAPFSLHFLRSICMCVINELLKINDFYWCFTNPKPWWVPFSSHSNVFVVTLHTINYANSAD